MSLPERTPASSLPKEKSPYKKKIASSASAITLLAGLAGCSVIERISNELDECPSVSKAEIASVRKVLDRPDNPLVSKAYKSKVITPEYSDFVERKAKEHKLTLIDYEPYAKRLLKAKSVDQMLSIVDQFSSNYGLDVEIDTGSKSDGPYKGAKPFYSANAIDKEKFKAGSFFFMSGIHYAPVEYIKESGVKTIRIEDTLKNNIKVGKHVGSAWGLYTENNIYLKADAFYTPNTVVFHELFHGQDIHMCGDDYRKDDKFTRTNPKNFQYGSDNDDGVGTVVLGNYSKVNVQEDKATLSQLLIPFISPDVFQLKGPLKEKSEILLARVHKTIAEKNNGADFISYLRDISSNRQEDK